MADARNKPKKYLQAHADYLDRLVQQGQYNIFGAPDKLMDRFPNLLRADAYDIHRYWRQQRKEKK